MDAVNGNRTSGQAICPDCPNTSAFKPYIDDPNNYYHYDPQSGTAAKAQMLSQVTVKAPPKGPEAAESNVAIILDKMSHQELEQAR